MRHPNPTHNIEATHIGWTTDGSIIRVRDIEDKKDSLYRVLMSGETREVATVWLWACQDGWVEFGNLVSPAQQENERENAALAVHDMLHDRSRPW